MLVLVRLELEDSRQLSLDMASHPMLPHFPLSLSLFCTGHRGLPEPRVETMAHGRRFVVIAELTKRFVTECWFSLFDYGCAHYF